MKGFIIVTHADLNEKMVVSINHIVCIETLGENTRLRLANGDDDLLVVEPINRLLSLIENAQ